MSMLVPLCCAIVWPAASRTTTVRVAGLLRALPDATTCEAPGWAVRVSAVDPPFLNDPLSDSVVVLEVLSGGVVERSAPIRNAELAVFQCVDRYEPAGGVAARK